jgi:DNA invertase Pin-like site-specific DNA recombinase
MNIAYIRVSTEEQNEMRQIEDMQPFDCEKFFVEKISGATRARPDLELMIKYAREGDKVIISELSRLGRNARDLLNIIHELQEKGVSVHAIKEGLDTGTEAGKLILTILAGFAEYERAMITARVRDGVAIAKKNGKYKGRQPVKVPKDFEKVSAQAQAGEITSVEAMKRLGLKKATYYRMLKENQIKFKESMGFSTSI